MPVKVTDVVKYRIFDRTLNAIVLAVRSGEVSHRGANDEPLLTLAFADPAREKMIAPQKKLRVLPEVSQAQVFIEVDVVHHSHEFDEEFLKKYGASPAQIAAQRGHGEWLTMDEHELESLAAEASAPAQNPENADEAISADAEGAPGMAEPADQETAD